MSGFDEELLALGVDLAQCEGCTDTEIEQIRESQAVAAIPADYAQFLRMAGKGAGRFMRGTDVFFPYPLELKIYAAELLEENGSDIQLGADALVFWMHQGYQFAWFPDVREVQPRVAMYLEGHDGIYREWPGLAEFLREMAG